MNERFAFDLELAGRSTVAGADEAGRGSLAGPLVAAAVSFDYAALNAGDFAALDRLNDSKKVPTARRAALYDEILRRARQVVIVCCSADTIDRVGLHRCNIAALARAVEGIVPGPAITLVDGFRLPGCGRAHRALVGGDGRSAAIAAASVVAKVTRDRLMRRLHLAHPQYGFDRHVGYATVAHHEAIAAHGVCALHRLSFASIAYRQLGLTFEREESPARG